MARPTSASLAVAQEGGSVSRQMINTLKNWAYQILENGRGISKWEQQFVESVVEQLEEGGGLSERQEEILDQIRTRRVP
jgi:hypothetical protein